MTDEEAKQSYVRNEYESQRIVKTEGSREQRLGEEDLYVYHDAKKERDDDLNYANRLYKERFKEQCFLLRGTTRTKIYVKMLLALPRKRDWKLSDEAYDAYLNKELRT